MPSLRQALEAIDTLKVALTERHVRRIGVLSGRRGAPDNLAALTSSKLDRLDNCDTVSLVRFGDRTELRFVQAILRLP
jgi:hypothetical protein